METAPFVSRVLEDEGLTSSLEEAEAQRLVDWLVQQTERIVARSSSEEQADESVNRLCRRARAAGMLVEAACYNADREAAGRLAARDGFPWPLPEHAGPALDTLLDHLAAGI